MTTTKDPPEKAATITVEQDRDRQQRHYEEIVELRGDVAVTRRKYDLARSKAKAAKDAYEDAVAHLLDLIDRGPDEQLRLFDDAPPEWRSVELVGNLELSAKTLELLAEAGITTLGALVDFTETAPLSDIKGIGPKKVEEIEAATVKFWADHPELAEAASTAETVDEQQDVAGKE